MAETVLSVKNGDKFGVGCLAVATGSRAVELSEHWPYSENAYIGSANALDMKAQKQHQTHHCFTYYILLSLAVAVSELKAIINCNLLYIGDIEEIVRNWFGWLLHDWFFFAYASNSIKMESYCYATETASCSYMRRETTTAITIAMKRTANLIFVGFGLSGLTSILVQMAIALTSNCIDTPEQVAPFDMFACY